MKDPKLQNYIEQAGQLLGMLSGYQVVREEAIKALAHAEMPNHKEERYRYASFKALKEQTFTLAEAPAVGEDITLAGAGLLSQLAARIVYLNGRFWEEASDYSELAQAARVRSLSSYFSSSEDRAIDRRANQDTLALLNMALAREGMTIAVPAGAVIDDPVEIHHLMHDAEGQATYPRHVIELGEGAGLTLIERYSGDHTAHFLNEYMQIRVSEGASLTHIRLIEEGALGMTMGRAAVSVDAGGRYQLVTLALSGAESRFEVEVRLLGGNSDVKIGGVLLAGEAMCHEILSDIVHVAADTTSSQVIRSIAACGGKTSFQGKIRVEKGAQKTDASQSSKALLLDRTGEANTKPELEIYADDVKCSHGATVGTLDEAALFYLTARGIEPYEARQMLIEAFAADALEALGEGTLQAILLLLVKGWMDEEKLKRSRPVKNK